MSIGSVIRSDSVLGDRIRTALGMARHLTSLSFLTIWCYAIRLLMANIHAMTCQRDVTDMRGRAAYIVCASTRSSKCGGGQQRQGSREDFKDQRPELHSIVDEGDVSYSWSEYKVREKGGGEE